MDLTGNIDEPYISFYASTAVSALFTGVSGDGEISTAGYHDVATWPSNSGDADFATCLGKGGSWAHGSGNLHVSRRDEEEYYDNNDYVRTRQQYFGGRGGR
jgi:hypothetical protein